MPVKRLGVASPPAYTSFFTELATADVACVASVIVANKGAVDLNATVYVEPVEAPGNPASYVYIVNSLVVGVGQSFETFRFAMAVGDKIYVAASTANAAFSATVAYESSGRSNIVYQSTQPGFPQVGDIWVNSSNDEVGVYTRQGNINIVAESADVNVESKSANFNVSALNAQFESESKFLVKSAAEIKFQSDTSIDFVAPLIQFGAENEFSVKASTFKMITGDSVKVESNGQSFTVDAQGGDISFKAALFKNKIEEKLSIDANSLDLNISCDMRAKLTGGFNLQSTDFVIDAVNYAVNGKASIVMSGATASYAASAKCFVGGASTEVGGIVSLGTGTAETPKSPSAPSVETPTVPTNPSDLPPCEFIRGSDAKEIIAKETNFPPEDA
jgi:hypothetical protein